MSSDNPRVEVRDDQANDAWDAEDDSILQLNPETLDPDYRYRFVFRDPNRLARLKARGYDFVVAGEETVELKDPSVGSSSTEGYICVGDTILMRCHKNRYNRRRERTRSLTEGRLGEGGEAAKAEINAVEAKTGIRSKIITD